jgi:hypothetical protein
MPLGVALYVGVIFWVTAFQWSQGRWDYYYLAEAFLDGRMWIPAFDRAVDTVIVDGRAFVPFAPFPAVVLMPLVWLFGVAALLPWEQTINATLAATEVALCWVLLGRIDGMQRRTRMWLVALFAFSTPVWWVTVLGGPWHFAQLVATALSLLGLIEAFGRQRPWLLGLIAATSFVTRPTLLLALPLWIAVALSGRDLRVGRIGASQLSRAVGVAAPVLVAIAISLWYNAVRFGSPLESGYALAGLPVELTGTRDHGLFSLAYLPRNLDYFLFALPVIGGSPWVVQPSGYGLSVLITSPALLLAFFADYSQRLNVAIAATAVAVLLPSLLYYGGGWFQLGFRYFLDSIPFIMVLAGSGAARRFGWPWKILIGVGTLVSLAGILWAYSVSFVPAG